MTDQTIHGVRPVFSASAALEAVGGELALIKSQDRLTWGDVAAVLGVSDDQAAKYADGTAAMNVVTFARAKREWNGRFTGALDRLCHDSRPGKDSDRKRHCHVLRAAVAFAEALADDDDFDADEVRANRPALEAARDAINDVLGKLTPRAIAG
ncbi:hypothetical protein [Sphingomonas sp.]|uniref:hypothetical protein n=1 Tax=Sphingomonas sp. TaxID=28214 RepID=UPI003B002CD5